MLEGNFSRCQHPRKGTRQTTDDKSCGRRVLRDGIDVYMNGLEDMVVGVDEARSWRRRRGRSYAWQMRTYLFDSFEASPVRKGGVESPNDSRER